MQWGLPWGNLWGGAVPAEPDHCGVSQNDLPDAFCGPIMQELMCILADRMQRIENTLASLDPAYILDTERAYGPFLDTVGSILGIPREGRTDAQYRRILTAWSLILLPGRRTADTLLAGSSAVYSSTISLLLPHYPKGFILIVSADSPDGLESDLIDIIKACTPATYRPSLGLAEPGLVFGYEQPGELADNPLIAGYSQPDGGIIGGNYIGHKDI